MKNTFTLILGVLAVAGCASTAPRADATFGDAVRVNIAAQTLDPAAGKNNDPVAGIDGQAGKLAIDRYRESFKAPPKTFEVINIGGAITGSGGN
jgi:hypothetical protein